MLKLLLLAHLLAMWGVERYEQKRNQPRYPVLWAGWATASIARHQGKWNETHLIAIAILESQWGKSNIAQEKHNLYGLKKKGAQ